MNKANRPPGTMRAGGIAFCLAAAAVLALGSASCGSAGRASLNRRADASGQPLAGDPESAIALLQAEIDLLLAESSWSAGTGTQTAEQRLKRAALGAEIAALQDLIDEAEGRLAALSGPPAAYEEEPPAGMPEIPQSARKISADGFVYGIPDGGGVIILGYSGGAAHVAVPQTLNGLPVTTIGDNAFARIHGKNRELPGALESLVVPEGVTAIGGGAFKGQESLRSVALPSTLRTLGAGAFENCASLQEIAVPQGVTVIGSRAFFLCSALKSAALPQGLRRLGGNAFAYCAGLEGIELPQGLAFIGRQAFYRCGGLASVNLPQGLEHIGSRAFRLYPGGAEASIGVTVSAGVTYAGTGSLASAGSAVIETDAAIDWNAAFTDSRDASGPYSALGGVSFANAAVHENAFRRGDWESGLAAGNARTGLEVTIGATVMSIGRSAFEGTNIKKLVIRPGGSLARISGRAFYNTCLDTGAEAEGGRWFLVIPGGVTRIGEEAFGGFQDFLEYVYFEGQIASASFAASAFPGDLREKYFAGLGRPGGFRRSGAGEWDRFASARQMEAMPLDGF